MQKRRTINALVKRLASIAHSICDLVRMSLERDAAPASLRAAYHDCSEMSGSAPSIPEFAAMIAELFAYSCFVARYYCGKPEAFQRQHLASLLCYAHPLHRQCVEAIVDMESGCAAMAGCIDEMARLLAGEDRESIDSSISDDPLAHFYELFLRCYNPHLRASRGIFYTPEPIVSYMVRSIEQLLRSRFACRDGLAEINTDIHILDPACGTGIFAQAVVERMQAGYRQHGRLAVWREHLQHYFLPRLTGIEVLITPYLIAHFRLKLFLADGNLPMPFRLDNALSGICMYQDSSSPIMIVLGNPPYAGHSDNKEAWITSLLDEYKEGYPELQRRAQAKWLSDDYVKFMRMAQWYIDRAGQGILAFITSHSYLDNPTFRGMRSSLLRSFDELFVLDLHGNSKKQEQFYGETKDENVFAIQPGVAINIFVKTGNCNHCKGGGGEDAGRGPLRSPSALSPEDKAHTSTLYHAHLRGSRVEKLSWLSSHDLESTSWTIQRPQAPYYLFAPQETRYLEEYQAGWSIPDIFRPNGNPAPGIITCHDEFAIAWSRDEAIERVEWLLATRDEEEARRHYRLCGQEQWNYIVAKKALSDGKWRQQLTSLLYRPFDTRWTVYNRYVAVHLRERVTRHMLPGKAQGGRENLALLIGKAGQVISQQAWDIVFCSRHITEFNLFRRGGNNIFPLYLAAKERQASQKVNLAPGFIADVTSRLGLQWVPEGRGDLRQNIGPEDVFAYIYALLHAPSYRSRYASFLKSDFPRIPLTRSLTLFRTLCGLGEKLVRLHLMESEAPLAPCYPVPGDDRIEHIRYVLYEANGAVGHVWINAVQYFENVPFVAWTLHIGGYQMCLKWLKDRKGRILSEEEIAHYQKMVAALAETARLMRGIDKVIERAGGWPLEM